MTSFSLAFLLLTACSDDPESTPDAGSDDTGVIATTDLGATQDTGGAEDTGGAPDMGVAVDTGAAQDTGASEDAGPPSMTAEMLLAATNAARAVEQDCAGTMVGPVPALTLNAALTTAAQGHADDMAMTGMLSLTWSGGTMTTADAAMTAGYPGFWLGENYSSGQPGVDELVVAYLGSETTCNSLMNAAATDMGGGYAVAESGMAYWSQVFGGPDMP